MYDTLGVHPSDDDKPCGAAHLMTLLNRLESRQELEPKSDLCCVSRLAMDKCRQITATKASRFGLGMDDPLVASAVNEAHIASRGIADRDHKLHVSFCHCVHLPECDRTVLLGAALSMAQLLMTVPSMCLKMVC